MKNVKAVFKKQVKDIRKNVGVLIQFIIYPAIAYIMTVMVARSGYQAEHIPDTMFVTMFSAIFVGMALIPSTAGIVTEDRERKSLRFLIMAGVKPSSYLIGIGGVIFTLSLLPSLAFSLMGGFRGVEFVLFMAAMMSGVAASTLLGLSLGIFAKNQQAATGLTLPVSMVLGFGPMIGNFNEDVRRFFTPFYTQQIDTLINGFESVGGNLNSTEVLQSFGIIWLNVAAFIVIFAYVFSKKGLQG